MAPSSNAKSGLDGGKLIQELNQSIQSLEGELARQNGAFAEEMRLQRIQLLDIVTSLAAQGPEATLVEYVKYNEYDFKGQRWKGQKYGVFVLLSDEKAPYAIDLGSAEPLDQAIAAFKAHMEEISQRGIAPSRKDEKVCRELGEVVRKLAWDPVDKILSGKKRVYLAADADLFLIPFEALPLGGREDKGYLVQQHEFVYLNAGRDLARFAMGSTQTPGKGAVIVAGPDFELEPAAQAKSICMLHNALQNGKDVAGLSPARSVEFVQASWSESMAILGGKMSSLGRMSMIPGAGEFCDTIKKDISKVEDIVTWVGPDAMAFRIKNINSPRILEILTHGVYLPEVEQEGSGPLGKNKKPFQNPLLRSRLAMAGVNHGYAVNLFQDSDGKFYPNPIKGANPITESTWLTAADVSGMNLQGTEIVALTACQTALGQLESGRTVAGLRRSFIRAGVRSIIMAQWSVPTDSSLSQMQRFYKNWLWNKTPRYQAFRASQLDAIKTSKKDWGSTHPWLWAGFIYVGDPGDLKKVPIDFSK